MVKIRRLWNLKNKDHVHFYACERALRTNTSPHVLVWYARDNYECHKSHLDAPVCSSPNPFLTSFPKRSSSLLPPKAYSMDTMQNELSTALNVDIAEDGDVILVVGPDKRRLRVLTSLLSNVSTVFRTMFGPHFSEGQNMGDTSSGPKEVHMPDDNADAIETICSLIHFRSVPDEIEPDLVLYVAVAADKFDCGIVLQHASRLWLDPKNSKDLIELARLMAASYLLDDPKAFNQVTLAMSFGHANSYLTLAEEDLGLDSSILLRICCMFLRHE
jgi:hypothetical protein